MILKSLVLKNFRKFKDTTIEFPDGVVGVVGLNGAGKSTIFEAVAWALYGPVAARTSVNEIKRRGADSLEPCRVELEFVFEGNNYRLVREMIGKNLSPQATVLVNGKVAATGAEAVNEYIQRTLGMDFRSFYTSIFAKQKELNALSSMTASERKLLVLKMLGIDTVDEVIKEVRSDKRNKDNLIEQLEYSIYDENGNEKTLIYKKEIENLEEKSRDIDREIENLRNKVDLLTKEINELEKIYLERKNRYEELKRKKEILIEKKELFERKKKIKESIDEKKKKIAEREELLNIEKKKLEKFTEIDKELDELEKKFEKLNSDVENLVKLIEKNETILDRIDRDINEIESKRKEIEKLGPDAPCPTCERLLSERYDFLLKKFEMEKKEKEKEKEEILLEIKEKEKKREKALKEQDALKKKKNYLQNQLLEKERISTTIKNILREQDRDDKEIKDLEGKFEEIGIIEFNQEEYEAIRKESKIVYEEYQKSMDVFSNKKDSLSELSLFLEKKEGEKKLIEQEIRNYKDKIKEIEKFKEQLKEEKKISNYLDILSSVLSDFKTYLISRIRPALSDYSSELFTRLTDGKYLSMEIDEDYNIQIYDTDGFYKINRFSGGEEDLANLCLRLAISEILTDMAGGMFNFIVLDEIFGSQDNIRRQNIMRALNNLSSKFRQIFLITHIEDIKNEVEHIMYVIEDESGISSVKLE